MKKYKHLTTKCISQAVENPFCYQENCIEQSFVLMPGTEFDFIL